MNLHRPCGPGEVWVAMLRAVRPAVCHNTEAATEGTGYWNGRRACSGSQTLNTGNAEAQDTGRGSDVCRRARRGCLSRFDHAANDDLNGSWSLACVSSPVVVGLDVRRRCGFAVAGGGVLMESSHGRDADCPAALAIPQHLAGFLQAREHRLRSIEIVIDGFGDLACGHGLAGKRQLAQDQLWHAPACAAPVECFGMIRFGIADGNFTAEHFHRRSKAFLPGFDQPSFLGFLCAQRKRLPSISLQSVQIPESFLKWCRHRRSR